MVSGEISRTHLCGSRQLEFSENLPPVKKLLGKSETLPNNSGRNLPELSHEPPAQLIMHTGDREMFSDYEYRLFLPTHDTGMVWENRHILGATVDPVAGIAFIMTGQAYKMAQQVKALGEGEN